MIFATRKARALTRSAALAGVVALVLGGCGGSADDGATASGGGKTTVTFWTWTPTDTQFEQLKAEFDKQYPDVEIDWWRTAEFSDYQQKLQTAMAAGDGPDLFGMQVGAVLEEYSRFAAPMDELADQYMPEWRDTISEPAVEQTTTSDGMVAAMPVITVGQEYYLYNKTLLAENGITEIPKTYAELVSVSQELKAKGVISMAMGAKDVWHDVDMFVALSQQFGPGDVASAEAGDLDWTSKTFVDTMAAWKAMFDDGVFQDGALGTGTYPDARDTYFYARKAALFPTGSWHVSVVIPNAETEGTAIVNDEIGMALFPQVGPEPAVAATGVDFALAVNKDSKVQEAAMKFVDFMTMGDGQQIWVNTLQGFPVNKNISIELADSASDTAKASVALIAKANQASTAARKLHYAELEEALGVAMQEVASGKSIEDALGDVQAVSDSIER